ncbi:uncharacterized protein SPAPADRAFT_58641 [Spathaspora passalidarum NRRL Y-27907]|uniref:Uncharacterized protein n=1 Tax=Spathaspora passalidarum (strain NRRL Y-27907 / 11-Y1) TaxID=619300 RepID=G3AGU1_SPAPN|nr:uncharacterized protein SPAPADRAFT_58641 [Spathaspora passalidarum NRRL Y-27907]EGW35424.1 hypothetical protein SPAPADRAFT_58641 [Spathaspora passalidarum NRRL Y-27907]
MNNYNNIGGLPPQPTQPPYPHSPYMSDRQPQHSLQQPFYDQQAGAYGTSNPYPSQEPTLQPEIPYTSHSYDNSDSESPPESPILHHVASNSSNISDIADFNRLNRKQSSELRTDERQYGLFSTFFFFISLVSAILIILFESYMFAVINIHHVDLGDGRYVEVSIYFALFIFAGIFQVLITIIGLKTRNMLLLFFLCLFYCCMLIYSGIQYNEVARRITVVLRGRWYKATFALNIATIAVIGATLLLQSIILIVALRKYVNWFTFKKVGADITLRRMFTVFQIHRSILMFDFFFFVGFTIQFVVIMVNDRTSVEFILTIVVLPCTIILLLISDISTCREFIFGSLFAIVLYLAGMAYVLFKIIRLYTHYTSAYGFAIEAGEYFMGRKSLTVFGVLTLVLLLITVVLECMVIYNFKKGLLPTVSTYYKWIPGYKKEAASSGINISDDDSEAKNQRTDSASDGYID